jgi:hypothetical protein
MSNDQAQSFVITFTPAHPCFSCERLTTHAHVTISITAHDKYSSIDPHIDIRCPLHGYYGPDTLNGHTEQDALDSVARFVIWMHADKGRVPLVSSIEDLSAVPDYELDEGDMAWHARYEAPDGARIDSYVVYGVDEWKFFLYERGVQVTERREEVA